MRTIKLKYVMLSLLFITAGSFAQTKKLSKNYKTSSDVNVELDSRHTNIIIENWDRNEVQIEAYLEGDTGDREMTKKLLDSWKLETSASNGKVQYRIWREYELEYGCRYRYGRTAGIFIRITGYVRAFNG